MTVRVWNPRNWRDIKRVVARVRVGDVIQNPVRPTKFEPEPDHWYCLAMQVGEELAKRGLKIDHPHCSIGFVEPL